MAVSRLVQHLDAVAHHHRDARFAHSVAGDCLVPLYRETVGECRLPVCHLFVCHQGGARLNVGHRDGAHDCVALEEDDCAAACYRAAVCRVVRSAAEVSWNYCEDICWSVLSLRLIFDCVDSVGKGLGIGLVEA